MLAREIDRPDDRRGMPDHYFLWSVQRVGVLYDLDLIDSSSRPPSPIARARVGVLYDLDLIDGKDWYAWGYKKLLPDQKNDGSWTGGGIYVGENTVLNTCFALLFLKRANLVMDLTEKLQLLAGMTGVAPPNSQPPAKKD